jgi:hypothetical protein
MVAGAASELAFGAVVTIRGVTHTDTEAAGFYVRLRAPDGTLFDDVPANAGRPRTIPSNYAPREPPLITAPAFQPPPPNRLVFTAVLATAVGIPPAAAAAASAVAALSPAGFSATAAAIRSISRGAPFVPASAFERGGLRPERARKPGTRCWMSRPRTRKPPPPRGRSRRRRPQQMSTTVAPLRPPIAGNVVMCRFLLGARFVLIAVCAGFAIIAPVSDAAAHIADIPFSVLSLAAPGISASQAPPPPSQDPAQPTGRIAVPMAQLPRRPPTRAPFSRALPRGLLGLGSTARRSTSAPDYASCALTAASRSSPRPSRPQIFFRSF